jgi:hypothetical protein
MIGDMTSSMEGITFPSALYLNVDYCHIKLDYDVDAQTLCTFVLPLGKYKCKRLPKEYQDWSDPDKVKNVISKLVQDMEYVNQTILS